MLSFMEMKKCFEFSYFYELISHKILISMVYHEMNSRFFDECYSKNLFHHIHFFIICGNN